LNIELPPALNPCPRLPSALPSCRSVQRSVQRYARLLHSYRFSMREVDVNSGSIQLIRNRCARGWWLLLCAQRLGCEGELEGLGELGLAPQQP